MFAPAPVVTSASLELAVFVFCLWSPEAYQCDRLSPRTILDVLIFFIVFLCSISQISTLTFIPFSPLLKWGLISSFPAWFCRGETSSSTVPFLCDTGRVVLDVGLQGFLQQIPQISTCPVFISFNLQFFLIPLSTPSWTQGLFGSPVV